MKTESNSRTLLALFLTLFAVAGIGAGSVLAQDDGAAPPPAGNEETTEPGAGSEAPDPDGKKEEAAGEEEGKKEERFADKIDGYVKPVSDKALEYVFEDFKIAEDENGNDIRIPIVLVMLAGTALIVTIFFKFINIRGVGTALRTVRGKYTDPDAPGQITHFQALSAALSATVGLGNIAGVAIAIGIGGPGATMWMVILGFLGMTTKFCECTLGVKYREIDEEGKVHGGAMYYLSKGFKEIGLGPIGAVLAILFAIFCIGGAFGAGNMFQISQATAQVQNEFGLFKGEDGSDGWQFGLIVAIAVGAVIIGGIKSIGRVASIIVPFMCAIYVIAAFAIVIMNAGKLGDAFSVIVSSAFAPTAVVGGIVGVLIQGIKRAAFSNEAGLGSAPIAHAAVKTDRPASEGLVALLEPLVDTVIVCTMTALVIVSTGMWKVTGTVKEETTAVLYAESNQDSNTLDNLDSESPVRIMGKSEDGKFLKVFQVDTDSVKIQDESERVEGWVLADSVNDRTASFAEGVWLTSKSFESVIDWFPTILTIAVILFCFSTMISWSYYGEQAVIYLFGHNHAVKLAYKIVFCLLTVVGAAASLGNILNLSDALIFAMVFPNLIGLYFLLPVVRRELKSYMEHVKRVDSSGK